ncbi:AT-hook motif nuclear-localized protein 5-like [Cynara cardunculus var. scolymus]|uniref:AT-hook motif nuclear-localized protein 5-like n=1 Tax=Cynara cardunculus var. scolymus TaxID=59895 RepID=UPI000D630EAE|nr:AT-hook motif nuclear-localized protein 5-like [Cynara cardunculus var. scolymus]
MDGREGMPSFYLNRGVSGSGSHAGSGSQGGGLHVPPPGFKTQSNPNMSPHGHSNIRVSSITYQMEHNISPVFPHGINMGGGGGGGGGIGGGGGGGAMSINTTPRSGSDSVVKKKRGRPRKYGPDGSHMALGLTPASVAASPGSVTPTPKKNRGRPPGSGRKQRLANVGEWMSNSAGLAFTPHIIHVATGEDVAAKVLSFAQQRPRALCILSGNGAISAVTLRQFTSTGGTVTYEGRFEILCLSGSYLLPETGSLNNRTGGLSISVCSADGHVIGGAIGGRLIASSLVQVVVCSFVHGSNNSKGKTKNDAASRDEESPGVETNETSPTTSQHPIAWPPDSRNELRNSHTEIDLTRG